MDYIELDEGEYDVPVGELPVNAVTLRPYGGGNIVRLITAARERNYLSRGWLTFRQALAEGLTPRGKGTGVMIKIVGKAPQKGEKWTPDQPLDAPEARRGRPLRTAYVFNLDVMEPAKGYNTEEEKSDRRKRLAELKAACESASSDDFDNESEDD